MIIFNSFTGIQLCNLSGWCQTMSFIKSTCNLCLCCHQLHCWLHTVVFCWLFSLFWSFTKCKALLKPLNQLPVWSISQISQGSINFSAFHGWKIFLKSQNSSYFVLKVSPFSILSVLEISTEKTTFRLTDIKYYHPVFWEKTTVRSLGGKYLNLIVFGLELSIMVLWKYRGNSGFSPIKAVSHFEFPLTFYYRSH